MNFATAKELMPDLEGSIMPEAVFMRDNYYLAVARYQLAARYAQNKIVLEAGSGAGYGAEILAKVAKKVLAIDTSKDSIRESQKKYEKKNLKFEIGDIRKLKFANKTFDLIVAFEIIEHLKEYKQAIKEFRRVLKSGGLLILSTPNKKVYSPGTKKPFYPFHYKEFTIEELKKLLADFKIKQISGQFIRGRNGLVYSYWSPKRVLRIIFANFPQKLKILTMKIYLNGFYWLHKIGLHRSEKVNLDDVYFDQNVSKARSLIIIAQKTN